MDWIRIDLDLSVTPTSPIEPFAPQPSLCGTLDGESYVPRAARSLRARDFSSRGGPQSASEQRFPQPCAYWTI